MRIFSKIRNFFESIGNVVKWFPVIWKDRDFDYGYLEEILRFKLKNMYEFFMSDRTWSVNAKETALEIKEVIDLLDKIQKDNYEQIIDPTYHKWIEMYPSNIFDNVNNFDKERRVQIYQQAEQLKFDDMKKVYELISQNIRKWWD